MGLRRSVYQGHSDEELMQAVVQKDQKAFSVLYDRYGDRVYNYFFRLLWKDKEKAEDFAQELFMKVIHHGENFDGSRQFKTWLFSIANNMCKNEYRKQEVRKNAHPELHYQASMNQTELPQDQLDQQGFEQALAMALLAMDEAKRTTFELRYKEEMSIKEISEILDCSEGTIKSRLFYTLKHLNQELKTYEGMLVALACILLPYITTIG
jgi:RNA polymerase sigma factor (sigma-70 family)